MGGVILAFFGNVFYNTGKEVSIHFQRRKRRKMGKKDIALARYFEDPRRYADLINGYVFGGEQVVRAEDIVEKDTRSTGVTRRGADDPRCRSTRISSGEWHWEQSLC